MGRKTKAETENTKTQILQAALDSFYEKGFSKTSFDDIAKRIGMTKGAVYWHFKDKAELLAELIKQQVEEKGYNFEKNNAIPANICELRDFFYNKSQYIENHPELKKFIFFITAQVEWSDTVFNTVINKIGDIRDFGLGIVQKTLTQAQKNGEISPQTDVKCAASAIAAMWRGALYFYISESDSQNIGLCENFMYGLNLLLKQLRKEN